MRRSGVQGLHCFSSQPHAKRDQGDGVVPDLRGREEGHVQRQPDTALRQSGQGGSRGAERRGARTGVEHTIGLWKLSMVHDILTDQVIGSSELTE